MSTSKWLDRAEVIFKERKPLVKSHCKTHSKSHIVKWHISQKWKDRKNDRKKVKREEIRKCFRPAAGRGFY